jgi:hypothetical protein
VANHQGRGLDASSRAYVEANVPPIISIWSNEELMKRSSPQLLKIINEKPEQLEQLFQKLSKLGVMQTFGDIKGDANTSVTTQNGKSLPPRILAPRNSRTGMRRLQYG